MLHSEINNNKVFSSKSERNDEIRLKKKELSTG